MEKIYLDNTNLIYILGGENSNIGNIRETFFYNQMRVKQDIISSKVSEFSNWRADIRKLAERAKDNSRLPKHKRDML